MKHKTIKDLFFFYIKENNGIVNYEDATNLIKTQFPNSDWKKTHWAWYKGHITRPNGKYYKEFSEEIRRNLSGNRQRIHSIPRKPQQTDSKNQSTTDKIYFFENKSEEVEKTIALCLGKVCHHIHPEIVNHIKKANVEYKKYFEKLNTKIDPSIFFYEGSDCVFPAVRRNVNKEKIGKWKNNINQEDNMILNDNTFPRHIWSFLSMGKSYNGDRWKECKLEEFELAHIFGHKVDEKNLEKKVFKKFDEKKLPYALFTSASNVVLIPNGLMKPTDDFETVKIAFYKRHLELYGDNLYSEKELNEDFIPKWYSDIIWNEPLLPDNWQMKIDNLLNYRKEYIKNKYTGRE